MIYAYRSGSSLHMDFLDSKPVEENRLRAARKTTSIWRVQIYWYEVRESLWPRPAQSWIGTWCVLTQQGSPVACKLATYARRAQSWVHILADHSSSLPMYCFTL